MSVTFPQSLTILEYFEFGRYGSIEVGLDRQMTPTAVVEPGSARGDRARGAERARADHARRRPERPESDPLIHPDGAELHPGECFRAAIF